MRKYACDFAFNVSTDFLPKLLTRCVALLDFRPFEVKVYFNEFKKSKKVLFYGLDSILAKLAKSEVDGGITSLTFCDEHSCPENVTPFFRIKIHDNTFKDGTVDCLFEWVAYDDLRWAYKGDFLLREILSEDVHFHYGLFFDQHDVFVQTKKDDNKSLRERLFGSPNWGRMERVRNVKFMAAPIMYFGTEYNAIMQLDKLEKFNGATRVLINGETIIRIDLYELTDNPEQNRDKQRTYWKTMNLQRIIDEYRQTRANAMDGVSYFKRRANLAEEKKHLH